MGGVECKCEEEEEEMGEKGLSKKYKIGAIVSILISSAIGVSIPMVGKTIPALHPEKDLFFLIKAFAAGVILSTGFIHVLPDAFEKLTSPCLTHHPWLDFPFTGFVAMVAAIGTLIVDSLATAYFKKSSHGHLQQPEPVVDQQHHVDLPLRTHSRSPPLLRYRVISQVLELGIVVHSVIIGISLGASENPKTIRPLIAALTFHQFFEGMGLGGCISQAKFKKRTVVIMALLFSLTTPVGIAIGMTITNGYKENNQHVLIVEGILNAASAGILIYMSLVDFLAADLMHPRVQSSGKLQIGFNASLLLGAPSMSVLAIWA